MCGLHIVVHADELEELINYYQVINWLLLNSKSLNYFVETLSKPGSLAPGRFLTWNISNCPYLLGSWLLWRADNDVGSSTWTGASAHGDVYRAGNSLLQIQAAEDEGALGAVLVQSQHPQGESLRP